MFRDFALLLYQFEDSVLLPGGDWVLRHYRGWLEREIARLEKRADPIFRKLWKDDTYRGIFVKRFLQPVTHSSDLPGLEKDRYWLALYRAVEPLAAAERTWGVEPSWEELEKAVARAPNRRATKGRPVRALVAYLKASLRREQILLDQGRDIVRIRKKKLELPEEYFASLAEEFEPTPEEIASEKARVWDRLRAGRRPLRPGESEED